jgi:DNA gyrase inhibitor GyrI/AraC-like DNA-binding protein
MLNEINKTRQEYIKRINYVLDFVEKNLDANLSLEQLSKKAHYSSFHFHRIFSAIVGETVNSFINRKRIERIASILLVGTNEPISKLAYKYGFNSENSFSRAFKKYYGITPTEFRFKGKDIISKIGIESLSMDKYICSIDNIRNWIDMNAQIEVKELQEIKLAAIMHIGKFNEIEETYKKLFEWVSQKEVLDIQSVKAVTIYHDNPKITPVSKVRLSVCVTINRDIDPQGEIRQIMIQKGSYVIGHFEITADFFQKAWDNMCVWVVENGYSFRDGDYFEVYHNNFKTHPDQKHIVDICIPIKKYNTDNEKEAKQITQDNLAHYRKEIKKGCIQVDYNRLIKCIKELRIHFAKEHPIDFKVGTLYQGNMNFTYFPFTTDALKKQKLKFVIIFNHEKMRFEISLSGQNKAIRKKYWNIFKNSDWDTYHVAESIDDSLSIIDHILVENPDFDNMDTLTEQIEAESIKFVTVIRDILE